MAEVDTSRIASSPHASLEVVGVRMIGTAELLEQTGATYRQIDYWVRKEFLQCETENLPGSGKVRRFNESEVRVAIFLVGLDMLMKRKPEMCDDIRECGFTKSYMGELPMKVEASVYE